MTEPKATRTYESEIAGAIHEVVEGFHEIGVVGKRTMRQFDELCLTPKWFSTFSGRATGTM